MKSVLLVLVSVVMISCSTVNNTPKRNPCLPPKNSRDYAQVEATLINVYPTMKGFKHLFVTGSGDTIARYYSSAKFTVGKCYKVTVLN